MSTPLDDLAYPEQAMFITGQYANMQTAQKWVLLVAAIYTGSTLGRLAELCGMGLPTVRNHLRTWSGVGAVELSGTSKDATVTFLGARAWLDAP